MSVYNLTPLENDNLFPFFGEVENEKEKWYKVYHDGGHHVGTRVLPSKKKGKKKTRSREDIDELVDSLFSVAMKKGLGIKRKKNELINFMRAGIEKLYPNFNATTEYIQGKIDKKFHNLYVRKKRFKRKAYLNRWNYFVTFTYDDKKQTEEGFRKKLRKCLSNLHTRRRLRYMGVFENAPKTERLHFAECRSGVFRRATKRQRYEERRKTREAAGTEKRISGRPRRAFTGKITFNRLPPLKSRHKGKIL